MSSLLRANAVAVIDRRGLGINPDNNAIVRMYGARVLREQEVGLERPISLAVPAIHTPTDTATVEETIENEAEPPPPPPDFVALSEAARVQGYDLGFEQGQTAGMAAAEKSMSASVQRLVALAGHVRENHAIFFRAAEREVVDLALQIAQKVVEKEVENMPDLAVNVIRSALEEMDARTAVRVRCSPDDEELLRRRWTQVVPPGIGAGKIELLKDERVKSGGAVIETTHGEVDAQLESKLAQLGNALWTFVMNTDSAGEAQVTTDA